MGTNKKIEALKKELKEAQKIMATNMEKLIVRGQKLEVLKDKSKALKEESHYFNKSATQLKNHLKARNLQMLFIILGIILGSLGALVSGGTWLGFVLQGALGGLLGYGLGMCASVVQQKFQFLSPWQRAVSQEKEIAVHLPHQPKRSFFGMFKKKDKKTVAKDKKAAAEDKDVDAPLTDEQRARLEEARQHISAFKKQEADNAEKLIERGELLDKLNSTTTDLKQQTETFQETAHKVERFEEAKNNHYTSIIIGLVGVMLGGLYGLIMGYSWPLMVVFGVLAGSLTYGLSTLVTKTGERFIAIGDWFKGFSLFNRAISDNRTEHVFEKTSALKQEQSFVQSSAKAIVLKYDAKANHAVNDKALQEENTLRRATRFSLH